MSKSKGNGRARITHVPKLHCESPGKQPQQFNPNFEVKHQDEPTPDSPLRQHYKLASATTDEADYAS